MTPQGWHGALLTAAVALPLVACAPSSDDVPTSGSQLRPTFRDHHGKDRKPPAHRAGEAGGQTGSTPRATPSSRASEATAQPSPSSATSSAGAEPAGSTSQSARLDDGPGDVSGVGAPAYVDLTGAVLERHGDRCRLAVTFAGALPAAQEGSQTMNVVGFVDTDLDGSVDYEVWANLADSGWGTSSRSPSGARFGDESGVEVAVSDGTLTLSFAAGVIGDADEFQWSVASEYGTYEQVAAGTTAQDHGPDQGAVAFPQ